MTKRMTYEIERVRTIVEVVSVTIDCSGDPDVDEEAAISSAACLPDDVWDLMDDDEEYAITDQYEETGDALDD